MYPPILTNILFKIVARSALFDDNSSRHAGVFMPRNGAVECVFPGFVKCHRNGCLITVLHGFRGGLSVGKSNIMRQNAVIFHEDFKPLTGIHFDDLW